MLTVLWEDVPENAAHAALLERLFAAACAATNTPTPVEVTLLLTTDDRLQSLNRDFRNKHAPSDVLSFPQRELPAESAGCRSAPLAEGSSCQPVVWEKSGDNLGDIAISLERVAAQAIAYGHSEERELAYLFVHGFLHLVGQTHADEGAYQQMRALEEAILSAAGLPRYTG